MLARMKKIIIALNIILLLITYFYLFLLEIHIYFFTIFIHDNISIQYRFLAQQRILELLKHLIWRVRLRNILENDINSLIYWKIIFFSEEGFVRRHLVALSLITIFNIWELSIKHSFKILLSTIIIKLVSKMALVILFFFFLKIPKIIAIIIIILPHLVLVFSNLWICLILLEMWSEIPILVSVLTLS